jgi:thymidylate kinase
VAAQRPDRRGGSVIRSALDRLASEGVAFATRGEQPIDDPPHGGDVDILVARRDAEPADRALRAAGFHYLESPGHRGHRFYLDFDEESARWLKIDVNLVPERLDWDLSARDEKHLRRFAGYRIGTKSDPGLAERLWSAAARRRPLGRRRQGPVVAMLGPDGAGKGSVIAALRSRIQATVTPVYLGHGELSRAEYARRPRARSRVPGGPRQLVRSLLSLLPSDVHEAQYRLRQVLLAALRVWAVYPYAWRGDIVLCDRHPIEQLAVAPADASRLRDVEHRLLMRLVPWPDAVIVLDAPGDVLFERKGEHTPALLERWRQAYVDVFEPRGAVVVCNDGELENTLSRASAVLWEALLARRAW